MSLIPKVVQVNLNLIEEEVLTSLNRDIYDLAKGASDALGATAEVMFDEIVDNGPQVEEIWKAYVNANVISFAELKAAQKIAQLNPGLVKTLSTLILPSVGDTLRALTDNETKDDKQIEQVWKNFLLEGNNLQILLDNTLRVLIVRAFKSDAIADILIPVAITEIKKFLNGGKKS